MIVIYIPILKNRLFENNLLRDNQNLFNDDIVPLIEIIDTKVGRRLLSIEEIINYYDSLFSSNYLIDFFTFRDGEFTGFDLHKMTFYNDHRNDTIDDYFRLLEMVGKTKNGIPCISIKNGRDFLLNQQSIVSLITNLQTKSLKIAIRIQATLFEKFFEIIHPQLREEDILIFDINESPIQSYYFVLQTIKKTKRNYTSIILHSPRPSRINNSSFKDGAFTDLIDNSIKKEFKELGFDGFSDYGGLKNKLPNSGIGNKGAALGLFYVESVNRFFSIVNYDVNQGTKGHLYVIERAFTDCYAQLNPKNNCPAFEYMKENFYSKGKPGQWGQWNYIIVLRYISQINQGLV